MILVTKVAEKLVKGDLLAAVSWDDAPAAVSAVAVGATVVTVDVGKNRYKLPKGTPVVLTRKVG